MQTIRASVADVQHTLLLTVGLVVGVILLFLRKLWGTVIPAISMPMSLIGTFTVLYARAAARRAAANWHRRRSQGCRAS
jgi:HAE1 family hydrophobic/amphiphilic exporter-1